MKNIYLNSEINLWTSLVLSFTNVIAKIYKGPTQLKLWMPVFQQIHCLDHLSKNKLEKAKSTVYIWTSFDSLHMVPNNVNKTCILLVNETDFNNLKKKYQLVDRIGVRVTQVCFFCNRNNSEDKLIFYKDHQGKPVFWELYRFIPLSYYFLSSFEYNSVFIVHLRWC